MAVPAFEFLKEPENALRNYLPPGASQDFNIGDPIQVTSNTMVVATDDTTELQAGECNGFACEPAAGIIAGSRDTTSAKAIANGFGSAAVGHLTYVPFNTPGLQFKTKNFYATGAPGTLVAPDTGNIGVVYQIVTGTNGGTDWGLEETAAASNDLGAFVDDVLDANEVSITISGGTGVWVVFHPDARGLAL